MKNLSLAPILFISSLVHAGIKTEKPPSFEDYLAVENTIETPPAVEAPKMDLGLKGMVDDRPEFKAELETAIQSWSFTRVREKRPMRANLKHLDFLYRNDLSLNSEN